MLLQFFKRNNGIKKKRERQPNKKGSGKGNRKRRKSKRKRKRGDSEQKQREIEKKQKTTKGTKKDKSPTLKLIENLPRQPSKQKLSNTPRPTTLAPRKLKPLTTTSQWKYWYQRVLCQLWELWGQHSGWIWCCLDILCLWTMAPWGLHGRV